MLAIIKEANLEVSDVIWQTIIFLCIAFLAVNVPLVYCLHIKSGTISITIDVLISTLFAVDFYRNFKTKTSPKMEPLLVLDVVACIPFDCLTYFLGFPPILRILRLVKMARINTLIDMFSTFGKVSVIPHIIKVPFLTICIIIAINFIASGWMLIYPPNGIDLLTFYNKSIYWTITTLTTIGYGDITPSTNIGRIYTMAIMILGVGVYGIVIGNVNRMLVNADRHLEQSRKKISDLNLFMKHYEIPKDLKEATYEYYKHHFQDHLSDNDSQIISDLPFALKSELQIYMSLKLLNDVPAFKYCSLTCRKEIAKSLEEVYYLPGEKIITTGETGDEMYIIAHGQVNVLIDCNSIVVLTSGKFFGEIALIEKTTRNADVVASASCDLLKLSKDNFNRITQDYPELLESVSRFLKKS
ncbi:MAG: cyclic nucleotide-binding domain-containing protein [Bacteriovoracaceae bacterium]|nr:cyclic nucleotide-binding domain-containing protein [Bacteriovoracaceae bacterium]